MSHFNRRLFLSRLVPALAALALPPRPVTAQEVGPAVPTWERTEDIAGELWYFRPWGARLFRAGTGWAFHFGERTSFLPTEDGGQARKLAEYQMVAWLKGDLIELERVAFAIGR